MDYATLSDEVLETWRRHHKILILLLDAVSRDGMKALPAGSRGRTVAVQFVHVDQVRRGWLQYFATGKSPKMPRIDKAHPPTKAQIRKILNESAKAVERFLAQSIEEGAEVTRFTRHAVRWMGYLISHESHHRGQIALALKQSGQRLPEEVAMDGLWRTWFWG